MSTAPAAVRAGLLLSAFLLAASGCIYDDAEVCGPNERVGDSGACVCVKGYAADANGDCVKQKPAAAALGAECDVNDNPCTDEKFSECHVTDGTAGYCTNTGCKTTDDCDGTFYCDTGEEPSYCRRVPTGQGEPCATMADCEGFEASYCLVNPIMAACLVPDCDDTSCTPNWNCADLSGVFPGTPKLCITEAM